MPASSVIHIQPPTSTDLKQYNAVQPDKPCTTTIDIPASQPYSSIYTYLHYNNAASTSQSSCYTKITHQLANIPTATYITVTPSTRNTQHHILAHACTRVLKTYVFPSTINIWNNHQRIISTAQRCHNLGKHCKPYHNRIGVGYTFNWSSIDTPHLLASSPIRIYIYIYI